MLVRVRRKVSGECARARVEALPSQEVDRGGIKLLRTSMGKDMEVRKSLLWVSDIVVLEQYLSRAYARQRMAMRTSRGVRLSVVVVVGGEVVELRLLWTVRRELSISVAWRSVSSRKVKTAAQVEGLFGLPLLETVFVSSRLLG